MTETPTLAPALTDEQIAMEGRRIQACASGRWPDAECISDDRFDAWLAAVIARAKRQERERIGAQTIYVVQEWVEADGIHDGWNTAYGNFTNSRVGAEATLEYLRKTHRDTEFRLATATRSDWKEAPMNELTDDEFSATGAHIERLWRDASQPAARLHDYHYTRDERAARHERALIADDIGVEKDSAADDAHLPNAYREGVVEGMERALLIVRTTR